MRSAPFWACYAKSQVVEEVWDCMNLEDGTDTLYRNVVKKLTFCARKISNQGAYIKVQMI
jgi:hypothetical protein